MTDEQYQKYAKIKEEIEPIKDFLFWCGHKYSSRGYGGYETKLIRKKSIFSIGRVAYGGMTSMDVKIPLELQDRIIDVVEQYVDEKQKELDEI